ncbi:MAG: STAS/SEC14 domain-containing protein [Thalassotalea sp.]
MLQIEIDDINEIATFTVGGKLSAADFLSATNIINLYIDEGKKLNGLIISTESFPGWESFAGFLSHLSFVKAHHKKIKCIALVTNSPFGFLAESLVSHFVAATVVAFNYDKLESAKLWIIENNTA